MPASAFLLGVRIASLNLCTDEYLLLLARPQEVAAVSYLSQDPLESSLWRPARQHPHNFGSVEQVLSSRPDLVLTMGGGGRGTALIAARVGIRTLDLPPPNSVADVATNLTRVAAALEDPARAAPWIRRLRALQRSAPPHSRDGIFLSGSGDSFRGGSVGAEWLRLAGLSQRALPSGRVTLETLLIRPPEVIVESDYRRKQVSAGTRWLSHPVVRNVNALRVKTDGRAWTCMGPLLIAEIERLRGTAK